MRKSFAGNDLWKIAWGIPGLLILLAAPGCKGQSGEKSAGSPRQPDAAVPGGIVTRPLASPGPARGRFTPLSGEETGLVFSNQLRPENMRKYLLNGAGMTTGDFDNDGLVDVYAVSQDGGNRLFRQTSPWKFTDVTRSAGELSGGRYQGSGASFADVDNDGWLDLYVCNIDGPNLLYLNQRDGTFQEQAEERNAGHRGATTMASFADYDRDGDLDLYLVNNRIFSLAEESPQIRLRKVGDRTVVHPDFQEQYFLLEGRTQASGQIQEAGQADRLLRNDGRGNFEDVTDASGIAGFDMGLSATWWDFDDDGWMDLYVANDLKSPDHLYRNLGNGKFEDVIAEAVGHTPWFAMGADAADINQDGLPDFLVADMSSTTHYKQKTTMGEMGNSSWFLTLGRPRQFMRNTLLVNSGTRRFFEAANLSGLDSTDWSWSVRFADFDSDSRVDVFVTNGVGRNMNDSDLAARYAELVARGDRAAAQAQMLKMPPLRETNLAFRNRGDLEFENVSESWNVNHHGVSHGASVADIDRDGDLDILVNHMNEPLGIYRNDLHAGNNLLVALKGTSSNRFGVNARVTVRCGDTELVRRINLARGFMSADEPVAHFGLGDQSAATWVMVEWPGGTTQRFDNVAANQFVTITEGTAGAVKRPARPPADPWFADATEPTGLIHRHVELEFDDFSIQPLLPNKLTQLGPGVAWGDVNADGLPDCFMAGAAGGRSRLFVQTTTGRFEERGSFAEARNSEDTGALWFDLDADDDLDLYVATGGYERQPGSPWLKNRLYLNDGRGNLQAAPPDRLPDTRSADGCVSAADLDRDGDLDLLVGSRLLPGRWPLPASSLLLENRDGTLVDATEERAAALREIGLVTSATWSDVDQDGWVDLLVTLEWGAIRFLHNRQGVLVDRTQEAGLADYQGWWNSISGGDIDNDGDVDFVAMNFGLNTKYHATDRHPAVLFARDFDNNGTLDLVEAEYEGDVCYPVRGKSCSSHAMPFLNERFDTFHEFALADLSRIYTDESLEQATRFSANYLRSAVLVNDGQGRFQVRSLPRMAQISPGFGTALEDFDGDGILDLAVAQNFLHPQPETGQMDGGMGMVLKGLGNGEFRMVSPAESGVVVAGQGMALTVADLDQDAAPDVVMSVNDEPARVWLNRTKSTRRRLTIALRSRVGNRHGVGSRVVLQTESGRLQAHDISAGEGYLSQSVPAIFASSDPRDPLTVIRVRWPDGSEGSYPVDPDQSSLRIEQPAAIAAAARGNDHEPDPAFDGQPGN